MIMCQEKSGAYTVFEGYKFTVTHSLVYTYLRCLVPPRIYNPRVIGILIGISTPIPFNSIVLQNQHSFCSICKISLFRSVALIGW